MRLSYYFKFRLPEGSDPVNVEDFNENFEEIDKKLNEVANKAGDVSKGTVFAETAKSRENLASGDTMATIIGKLMRWLADLGTAAFCGVANNDNTEAAGYVADARVLKTHKTALDKHEEELGGLYFGTDGSGKWGYKTSKNGAVTAFRKPAGNASVGDVLSGKTFANASNDSLTGTMPNRGAWTGETTGNGNVAIPAGYHNGSGYVSGAGAYNAGVAAADGRVSEDSKSYKSGYEAGKASVTVKKLQKTMQKGESWNLSGYNVVGYGILGNSFDYYSWDNGSMDINGGISYSNGTLKYDASGSTGEGNNRLNGSSATVVVYYI